MNYSEIIGAAKYHHAIAISQPRKSHHSFTGQCVDVFFNDPNELIRFQKIIEYKINHFVAVSYESDYARARVPCNIE